MTEERIQKLLAQAGYGSRRACEVFITEHRVTVNGKVAELGAKADPERDVIKVDGKRMHQAEKKIYVALNKPSGIVTTNLDEFERKTVRDLVPIEGHLYPVGRLDADSEGLVLLTNDGDLANALTHPRYEHEKEYRVLVEGEPSESTLKAWRRGVLLEGVKTAPSGSGNNRRRAGSNVAADHHARGPQAADSGSGRHAGASREIFAARAHRPDSAGYHEVG